jgi:hypothetical protein
MTYLSRCGRLRVRAHLLLGSVADAHSWARGRQVDMRRREFISLLSAAATWPLAASAQQPGKIPRIGIIDDAPRWNAFRHGLRDLGYLEGQNIRL